MKAAGHLKTMLVSLWIAAPLCVADDASALGYLQLSFGSEQAGYGNGHVQYDPASLTPYYDYRDAWMACEASGDFGPCDELPRWINFGLSITEAELRISGAVFETSDFSWSFYVTGECFIEDCGRDYSSINIDNGLLASDFFDGWAKGRLHDAGAHKSLIHGQATVLPA